MGRIRKQPTFSQVRILLFRQIKPDSASTVFNTIIKRLAPFKIQI